MTDPNAEETDRDETMLIARMAYNEAMRKRLGEEAAQAAFDKTLEERTY
jgi:hypothetical protein